jgi:hypothetical protein
MSNSDSGKTSKLHSKTLHRVNSTAKSGGPKLAVLVAALALLLAIVVTQSNSNSGNGGVKLYLTPSTKKVSSGGVLNLQVWLDAKDQPINAVQANISYPDSKFDFKNIDTTGSAFEIEAQSTGSNGKVNIARGHIGKITGIQLVASVSLLATSTTGSADVGFSQGTVVVRSTDNTNVLKSTSTINSIHF